MAKNRSSVQSLFQEEFQSHKPKEPAAEKKTAEKIEPEKRETHPEEKKETKKRTAAQEVSAGTTAPERSEAPAVPKNTAASEAQVSSKKKDVLNAQAASRYEDVPVDPAASTDSAAPASQTAPSIRSATDRKSASGHPFSRTGGKKEYRPSSIYLSGENVNFVKYITRENRISQKQYINDLLLEKQAMIERDNPLTEQKKVIDFKQPVRGKYRSFKENSTIYSISVPAELSDYFEKVCERDHITFSTMVDDLLTERREAFLKEQGGE